TFPVLGSFVNNATNFYVVQLANHSITWNPLTSPINKSWPEFSTSFLPRRGRSRAISTRTLRSIPPLFRPTSTSCTRARSTRSWHARRNFSSTGPPNDHLGAAIEKALSLALALQYATHHQVELCCTRGTVDLVGDVGG
ncbi:hypothetical protein BC938DRAFT_477977, partial [Jimgerdemannia flammicorona]